MTVDQAFMFAYIPQILTHIVLLVCTALRLSPNLVAMAAYASVAALVGNIGHVVGVAADIPARYELMAEGIILTAIFFGMTLFRLPGAASTRNQSPTGKTTRECGDMR